MLGFDAKALVVSLNIIYRIAGRSMPHKYIKGAQNKK